MEIIKKHISKNYSIGRVITPKYIVIHNTDNEDKGANAEAHYNYWNTNNNANSSVHFVVDDSKYIQLLELNERAWHVGDNKGYSNITNNNSIGIEICVNVDGDFNKAYANAIELVKYLIKATGIPVDRVVRHKDASGKYCPRKIMDLNLWEDFKNKINEQQLPNPQPTPEKELEIWELNINGPIIKGLQHEVNVQYNAGIKEDGWAGIITIDHLPIVRYGAKGNITRIAQNLLLMKGYKLPKYGADSTYGTEMKTAVLQFQNDNGLTPDSIIGKNTWKALLRK